MTSKADKKTSTNRLSLGMKCGDCWHFRGPKAEAFTDKCSELGIKRFAKACNHFTPNAFQLGKVNETAIHHLTQVSRLCSNPSELRLLAYMLKNMSLIQRLGFAFGQRVYVNLSSPRIEYLECYYKAYVVGAIESEDALVLASSLGQEDAKISLLMPAESVIPASQFKSRKEKLVERNRIVVPTKKERSKLKMIMEVPQFDPETDEIPTMDEAPEEWLRQFQTSDDPASFVGEPDEDGSVEETEDGQVMSW